MLNYKLVVFVYDLYVIIIYMILYGLNYYGEKW